MIIVRRAAERHLNRRRKQEQWLTFNPADREDRLGNGFGFLEVLSENHVPPGAAIPRHRSGDGEMITYVREGALAYEDSLGRSGVIHAGEFQRLTAGKGFHHSERNASQTEWAHIFQSWVHFAEPSHESGQEQKRFSVAERRGRLCVVASPDGRNGSLRLHQDALMFSAMLYQGHHVVHEIAAMRSAWLHIVQGEVLLAGLILKTGDGVGLIDEHAMSFTTHEETEILVFNLGVDAAAPAALKPADEIPSAEPGRCAGESR